ncbi:MAG TPA: lysophospholipid acyltransferase family protein [Pirellulales bacterium]|nr:lysophospholipid acyltransferase family protein [Pirellulales bacterium]
MLSLPSIKRAWYDVSRATCRVVFVVVFGVRVRGREWFPREGGVLLVSNHQSHLDPVLAGVACDRQMTTLARDTLFRIPLFRNLINSYDAIPLDREGVGLAGVKETMRRLKQGKVVLVFPEGTRTSDGQVAPLKPGFCALARRTRVPVMPVAVAGAFDAWPRWRPWPCPATIHIQYGRPISPAEIAAMDDAALVVEVEARLAACQHEADAYRRRAVRELPAVPAASTPSH